MEEFNQEVKFDKYGNPVQDYLEKLKDSNSQESKDLKKWIDEYFEKMENEKEVVTQHYYLRWLNHFMQKQVKGNHFDDEEFAYFPENFSATEIDKRNVHLLCSFIEYVLNPFINYEDYMQIGCYFSINNNYYFIEEVHGQGTSIMIDKLKEEPNEKYAILKY